MLAQGREHSMSSTETAAFLAWYQNLWVSTVGDQESAVTGLENRLDCKLPDLLRGVYLFTSMRDSQMLHLAELPQVSLKNGVLVFAREQQSCWSWGIRVDQLGEKNPQLVADPNGKWVDDGCSLEEFLRFYSLANRPYEPPFIDQSAYDDQLLNGQWKRHEVKWSSIKHSLWTNGEAVLEEEIGNLGARDAKALRRAAQSLDIDEDEVDGALESASGTRPERGSG